MTARNEEPADGAFADSGSRTRALAVGLAALALILAALAVPPLASQVDGQPGSGAESGGSASGSGGQADGSGSGSGGAADGTGSGGGEDGAGSGDGGAPGGSPGGGDYVIREGVRNESGYPGEVVGVCHVLLRERPVPGARIQVQVWHDGEPVVDRPVRFGDRRIGRTDDRGRVTGRVPYERTLEIAVEEVDAGGDGCAVSLLAEALSGESNAVNPGDRLAAGSLDTTSVDVDRLDTGRLDTGRLDTDRSDQRTVATGQPSQGSPSVTAAGDVERSVTVTVPVSGRVEISVDGRPRPGETVVVEASIDDEPISEALVTVDGRDVGRTDAAGRYRFDLPDDGRNQVRLGVERGEFRGERTITLQGIDIAVVPDRYLAVPGAPARLVVTAGGEPVEGITVRRDGTTVGETGPEGTLDVTLPSTLEATYTVRDAQGSDHADVRDLYVETALTALLLVVLATLTTFLTRRRLGVGPARLVGGGWIAILVPGAAWVAWGQAGASLAAAGLLLLGLGIVAHRERTRIAGGLGATPSFLRGLWTWGVRAAFRAAAVFGWLSDAIRARTARLGRWLRTRPRSIRGLLAGLRRWLGSLPGGLRRGAGRTIRGIASGLVATCRRAWSPWRALIAAALIALVAGLTWRYDETGFLAGVGLVIGLLTVAVWRQEGPSETGARDEPTAAGSAPASTGPSEGSAGDSSPAPTIRECWRAFARRVAPGRWRVSTPGEIARQAVDRGFPPESVAELTAAFRELEYGHRRLGEDRRERAEAAYQRLQSTDTDPEDRRWSS